MQGKYPPLFLEVWRLETHSTFFFLCELLQSHVDNVSQLSVCAPPPSRPFSRVCRFSEHWGGFLQLSYLSAEHALSPQKSLFPSQPVLLTTFYLNAFRNFSGDSRHFTLHLFFIHNTVTLAGGKLNGLPQLPCIKLTKAWQSIYSFNQVNKQPLEPKPSNVDVYAG